MPHKQVVLFLDRSVGKRAVATELRAAGASVELHDDHFAPDTPDRDWIFEVTRRGWAIITKDSRIRYRPLERSAVKAAKAQLFVLASGNTSGPEMAQMLVRHLSRIQRIAVGERPPFIALVSRSRVSISRLRQ